MFYACSILLVWLKLKLTSACFACSVDGVGIIMRESGMDDELVN